MTFNNRPLDFSTTFGVPTIGWPSPLTAAKAFPVALRFP
jgi:hypothetical protein